MQRQMNPHVAIAYQYLLKKIMSFELEPGRVIVDSQIAKELDMSRAPVREAVLQLVTDGMIRSADGKMTVTPINIDDIADILCVRTALETECLRIIERNGWLCDSQEKTLRQIHKQMAESASTASISEHYQFDDMFHSEIVSAAGSPRIRNITEQMGLQMQRARWLNLAVPSRQTAAIEEHSSILDAILHHDYPAAEDSMRNHLKNSETAFRAVLEDKQAHRMAKAIGCLIG